MLSDDLSKDKAIVDGVALKSKRRFWAKFRAKQVRQMGRIHQGVLRGNGLFCDTPQHQSRAPKKTLLAKQKAENLRFFVISGGNENDPKSKRIVLERNVALCATSTVFFVIL